MRKHHGMRPQDVAILLKISTLNDAGWHGKDLAAALCISPAEVSDALRRCQYAGLLQEGPRTVVRKRLFQFLVYGLPYVFPTRPGTYGRGFPTAHSALSALLPSDDASEPAYVWPAPDGPVWGVAIEPLYPGALPAAQLDTTLYELLALTDALRTGLPVQWSNAKKLLRRQLLQD